MANVANADGFSEILINASSSIGYAFEIMAGPIQLTNNGIIGMLILAATVGITMTVLGSQFGMTDPGANTRRIAMSAIVIVFFVPIRTMPVENNTYNGKPVTIGLGPWALMAGSQMYLNIVSKVGKSISGDRMAIGNAVGTVLAKTGTKEAVVTALDGADEELLLPVMSYLNICGNAPIDYTKRSNNADSQPVTDVVWRVIGLSGGLTLGQLEDPLSGISTPKSKNEPTLWNSLTNFFAGSIQGNVSISEKNKELQSALSYLEEYRSSVKPLNYGRPIHIKGEKYYEERFANTESLAGNDENLIDASSIPSVFSSMEKGKLEINNLAAINGGKNEFTSVAKTLNSAKQEDFYAYNCLDLYLIANKSMREFSKGKKTQYLETVIGNPTSFAHNAALSFDEQVELGEKSQAMLNIQAGQAIQMANSAAKKKALLHDCINQNSNSAENCNETGGIIDSVFEMATDAMSHLKDTVLGAASGGIQTAKNALESLNQDVLVPSVAGGLVLFLAFMMILMPLVAAVALVTPWGVDSFYEGIKLCFFAVIALSVMTVLSSMHAAMYDSFAVSFANSSAYQASPSSTLASFLMAMNKIGLAIVVISFYLSYFIVFTRATFIAPSSNNITINDATKLARFGNEISKNVNLPSRYDEGPTNGVTFNPVGPVSTPGLGNALGYGGTNFTGNGSGSVWRSGVDTPPVTPAAANHMPMSTSGGRSDAPALGQLETPSSNANMSSTEKGTVSADTLPSFGGHKQSVDLGKNQSDGRNESDNQHKTNDYQSDFGGSESSGTSQSGDNRLSESTLPWSGSGTPGAESTERLSTDTLPSFGSNPRQYNDHDSDRLSESTLPGFRDSGERGALSEDTLPGINPLNKGPDDHA